MSEPETLGPVLSSLLDIMTSDKVSDDEAIEAARAIIEYESPPGVHELAQDYLTSVAQNERKKPGLRLEALKLLRKVESRRVSPFS